MSHPASTQQSKIFRRESLERLASPERLDQLMKIVRPIDWLPLATLGSLLGTALIWSIFGRIPITVTGQGVLIYPQQIVAIQSPVSGRINRLNVKAGDLLEKGTLIAEVDTIDQEKQLQENRAKLKELETQNLSSTNLQTQSNQFQLIAMEQQRQNLIKQIQEYKALTPTINAKNIDLIRKEIEALKVQLQNLETLRPDIERRLKNREILLKERLITEELYVQVRQELLTNSADIANVTSQLKQEEVKESNTEKTYQDSLNNILTLQSQLQDLDTKKAQIIQQTVDNEHNRINQIMDTKRAIEQQETQLKKNSQVISDYSGRLIELSVAQGQVLNLGTRVGFVETKLKPGNHLVAITYFSVGDGKKIEQSLKAQKVRDKNLEVEVTPTTVERERFGGIKGHVISVSLFSVTAQGVENLVGTSELAQNLVNGGPKVEVISELIKDSSTFSGYAWSSSKGPQLSISSGSVTSVRATVEEYPPITFVLPFLKSFFGVS